MNFDEEEDDILFASRNVWLPESWRQLVWVKPWLQRSVYHITSELKLQDRYDY